jgi:RNA polymerase sigma-70 factor (ECF subfamily)
VALPERLNSSQHEEYLIQACREGDRQALDRLFRAQAPALHRLLLRLVGPRPEVEDLLEATFMAAIDAFPRFRGEATVERWLASIATRIAFRHFRYSKHRRHASLELLRGPAEPLDHRPEPDRAAENRRRIERLYHHLEKLGPKKRIPFVLYFLEGRPIDEVAAIIGENSVLTKGRIFHARRTLMARAQKDPVLKDLFTAREGQ